MKKNQTPHFLPTALLAATALACALAATPARAAKWASISVPGDIYSSDEWNKDAHFLASYSGTVWSGALTADKNGDFKFVANQDWSTAWGADGFYIQRLPATDVGPLVTNSGGQYNIHLQAVSAPTTLGFSFDEEALTFSITTPAPPSVSSARLVGSFNNDGAADATSGVLKRGTDGLWTVDLTLASADNLRLRVNDSEDWGPPATVLSPVPLTVPLCSSSSFSVDDFRPGDFRATFDTNNLTLTLVQTRTNVFTRAAIAADGTLSALGTQNVNLVKDGSLYTGSFWVSAASSSDTAFTLSFSERDADGLPGGGLYWSATNSTAITLSAGAHTETFSPVTKAAAVVRRPFKVQQPGFYKITFDPADGTATIQRSYAASSGINLFSDPSFESGNGWTFYHAQRPWGTNDAPGLHSGSAAAMFLPLQRHPKEYQGFCDYVYNVQNGDPDHGVAPGTAWENVPGSWVCPECGMHKDHFSKTGEETDQYKGYCGHVYNNENGDPDHGVAPGTAWEDVPQSWVCPECGMRKEKFTRVNNNYGSISTSFDVTKYRGSALRVSAWFRTVGPWTATKTRIWIEWKDAAWNTLSEKDSTIYNLSSFWQPFSLDAVVPDDAVKANVLFAFTGSTEGDGYLLVDDAEARVSASRFLDFDTWGEISTGSFRPDYGSDWKVAYGRTTNNANDAFLESGSLFISKYIEGSNNNKAIELYNPTTSKIDLSGWKLQQYDNGSSTPTATFDLSGTVETGKCFLISRTVDFTAADGEKYKPLILDSALTNAPLKFYGLTFNGDDVIVLRDPSGNIADRVGQVRPDITGSLLAYVMRDHTLVRSSYTARGTAGDPTNDFPYSEWEIRPCDNFDDLGSHTRVLPPDVYIPSGLSLVLGGNPAGVLTSPAEPLDGGVGDISFWYRTAFPESAGKNGSATLVLEASSSYDFSGATEIARLTIPSTQYAFSNFFFHADLPDAAYFRIRSTDVTGGAFARIDDLSVGATIASSRYQDFNVWTNASWQAYIGNYSLGGWSIANGRLDFANGASGTPAAVLPSGATVTSPSFDSGIGQIRFATSADPNDDDSSSYSVDVSISTDDGATWTRIDTLSGSGVSNWVAQALAAGESSSAAVRFTSAGPGNVLLDNIELWIPEEDSRSQTFDAWVQNSYGSSKHQGWSISSALTSTDAGMNSTRGLRVKSSGAWVQSPVLDGGVGTVSFYARPSSASASPGFALETLAAGSTKWTTARNFRLYGSESTDWQAFAVPIDSESVAQVRLILTNSQALCLENIVCARIPTPPSLDLSAFLDPATPYPDEAFSFGAHVNPVGSTRQSDILSVVANYRFQKGSSVTNDTVPLAYSPAAGAWVAPDTTFKLADGTKVVYSATATWTSNGTTVVSTSPNSTNFISTLANAGVWINEVFYTINTNYDKGDIWFGGAQQNHEYVEICGPAGTDLTGWKLVFQLSRPVEIAQYGKADYATYTFPKTASGIKLPDAGNGYGFFLVGDANDEWTPNVAFGTNYVPAALSASAATDHDNLYDGAGVIVLKNAQNVVVDSVSYSLAVAGTTSIGSQEGLNPTNALSAVGGPGYCGADFAWNASQAPTPGAANLNQSFTNRSTSSKTTPFAWHVPSVRVVPDLSTTDPFFMLAPWHVVTEVVTNGGIVVTNVLGTNPPTVADTVTFNLAFSHESYNPDKARGTLYYRTPRNTDFVPVELTLHQNSQSSTNAFLWTPDDPAAFPPYFFHRLDTVEYYFVFEPGESDYTYAYIASDGAGGSAVYEPDDDEGAETHPFVFTFPFHDEIFFISLPDAKDTLGSDYCFTNTVSFPADPGVPGKLVFFDSDLTGPPGEDELKLEAAPTLLDTNAWYRIPFYSFDQVPHGSDPGKGTYYFIEFDQPTNPASFFRIVPFLQPSPADAQ